MPQTRGIHLRRSQIIRLVVIVAIGAAVITLVTSGVGGTILVAWSLSAGALDRQRWPVVVVGVGARQRSRT